MLPIDLEKARRSAPGTRFRAIVKSKTATWLQDRVAELTELERVEA